MWGALRLVQQSCSNVRCCPLALIRHLSPKHPQHETSAGSEKVPSLAANWQVRHLRCCCAPSPPPAPK